MANGYRGQTPLLVGDRELTLQIDYDAVGSFLSLLDGKDWPGAIMKAFDDYDMQVVSRIVQIAAKRHHPEITSEEIFLAAPPFQTTLRALEASMLCFLYGHPKALENLDLREHTGEDQEASGTDPLPSGRARWRERGKSLMKSVFRGASSGA